MSSYRADHHGFTSEQWHYLTETLRLRPASSADSRSTGARALLDPERCQRVLQRVGPVIGTTDRRITASLLSKRLAFLFTGAPLYALSACDRGLDLSLDNCIIDYAHDGGRWTSSLPLRSLENRYWSPDAREAARRDVVQGLFAGLIAPLWRMLEAQGGVSARILWENLAVRVYSLYERRLALIEDDAVRARCAMDFAFLRRAEPALFGLDFNPIARFFYARSATSEGGVVRFRRTCCLYFKATCPQEYCENCPLVKPREGRGNSHWRRGGPDALRLVDVSGRPAPTGREPS